jgi:hypothetical protein
MIAVHGFSYGGAEHSDTAEESLFHILHANAQSSTWHRRISYFCARKEVTLGILSSGNVTSIQVLAFLFSMGSYSEHAALIRRKDDEAAS